MEKIFQFIHIFKLISIYCANYFYFYLVIISTFSLYQWFFYFSLNKWANILFPAISQRLSNCIYEFTVFLFLFVLALRAFTYSLPSSLIFYVWTQKKLFELIVPTFVFVLLRMCFMLVAGNFQPTLQAYSLSWESDPEVHTEGFHSEGFLRCQASGQMRSESLFSCPSLLVTLSSWVPYL